MYGNIVYIGKSKICNGFGIFAKKNINKGDIITWYYGYIVKSNNSNTNIKYLMDYDILNEKTTLVGISDINKIKYGKGVAQLANDAICIELTGKKNNSYFTQRGRYILLIASTNINKNDEILVPYGIDYWKGQLKSNTDEYDENFKHIIHILFFSCQFSNIQQFLIRSTI